ncbi:MAG: hypothetical protein ACLSWY_05895 [Ruthenibacterium lactatiformans]
MDAAGGLCVSRMTPEEMYAVDFCGDHELPLEFIFPTHTMYMGIRGLCGKVRAEHCVGFDSVLRDGGDRCAICRTCPSAPARQWTRHAAAFEANTAIWATVHSCTGRRCGGRKAGVGRLLERLVSWAETALATVKATGAAGGGGLAVAMEGGA